VTTPERGPRGWVIGRAAGAPVVLSFGWVVAAAVLVLLALPLARTYAPTAGPAGVWLLAVSAVAMLVGSTFLHELAHALVARRHAMVVRAIALTLVGGHTELDARVPRPSASAQVAAAGPVANLVLAAAAWGVWQVAPHGTPGSALVLAMAATNGFVALLNLLPGLPLDGGRVLEAAVWAATGRQSTGTRAAAWAGRVVAVGIVAATAWPLLGGGRVDLTGVAWGALIGAFMWSGAGQALRAARLEQAVERIRVAALMTPAFAVPAGGAVGALDVLAARAGAGVDAVVVGPGGVPQAWVDAAAAAAVPPPHRASTPLVAVAVPLPPEARVVVDLVGRAAVAAVARASQRSAVVAVTGAGGGVVGLLRAADVARALRA
jgi:Zn-dependent protease